MANKKRIPKKRKLSAYLPLALFVMAAVLLIGSTVGSVQATLTYVSEYYDAHVEMKEIGVTLVENGKAVSYRDYADNGNWSTGTGILLGKDNSKIGDVEFKLGQVYDEALSVTNSGEIPQYVRVRVFKSWQRQDQSGKWVKAPELAPEMIDLHFVDGTWMRDESACTRERTVLYYPYILNPGDSSTIFTDTIKIDNAVVTRVPKNVEETVTKDAAGRTIITTTYSYDGVRFLIEAEVDAVQTHNAVDAIKSAWGVDVRIDGTVMSIG